MRKLNLRSSAAHITEKRFNNSSERVVGANGEINAGNRQELMGKLVEIASMVQAGEMWTDVAGTDLDNTEERKSNRAMLEEAFHDPAAWKELGAGLAAEIQERLLRNGFMRNILLRGDVEEGNVPRIRVRTPNVVAVVSRGVGVHWPQYVRDKIITVDEFALNATPEVDELELHQNSGDILEDKFYEGMEGIYAGEDRVLVGGMRAATGIYNAPTYFSGNFTQVVLQALRQAVTDWVLPVQTLILANDLLSDIMVGDEFSTWFDPISKWEIVQTGRLGNLLGLDIITDGYREPVFQVLKRGEAFVTSQPINNGVYTDRGPVRSTPIDGHLKGTNTKGWNINEYISVTWANAKAVATAQRV